MTTRLAGLDTAFVCLDTPTSPMHIGAVLTFSAHGTARPLQALRTRAARNFQFRQRIQRGRLPTTDMTWVEDENFDVDAHLFVHKLRGQGGPEQLSARIEGLLATPLDLRKPPWELHLITGLDSGKFALLAKMHHALADGARAIMLGLSLLDEIPGASRFLSGTDGNPAASGDSEQSGGFSSLRQLPGLVAGLPGTARNVGRNAGKLLGLTADVLRRTRLAPLPSPLLAGPSTERGLRTMRLDLAEITRVRRTYGGTANDVLLATFSGALRRWLRGRDYPVDAFTPRALVPVNRRSRDGGGRGANRLSGYLCDLPVDEADAITALGRIRGCMDANKRVGPERGAGALPLLADEIPAVVHRVATPVAGQLAGLLFDVVVTNVSLPDLPLSLDGAELESLYPIVPLAPGHAVGVAFCTYRGVVHIGLHTNNRAVRDADRLAEGFAAALHELSGESAEAADDAVVPRPRAELRRQVDAEEKAAQYG